MGPKREREILQHQPFGVYCLQFDIGCNVNRQQIESAVEESGGNGIIVDVLRVKRALWVIYLNGNHAVEVLTNKGIKVNGQKVKVHKGNYDQAKKNVLAGVHAEIKDNPFSDTEDEGMDCFIASL